MAAIVMPEGVVASVEVSDCYMRRTCSARESPRHAAISVSLGVADGVTVRNKARCSDVMAGIRIGRNYDKTNLEPRKFIVPKRY